MTLQQSANNYTQVALMETLSTQFHEIAVTRPECYATVDLSDRLRGEDLDALVMMRRSRGNLSSLVMKKFTDKCYILRCLAPFQSGNLLQKLHLLRLCGISQESFLPVLASCTNLKDVHIDMLFLQLLFFVFYLCFS